MMTKYKILKDFVDIDGELMHNGNTYYWHEDEDVPFIQALTEHGYIEEIFEKPKTVWDLENGDKYFYYNPVMDNVNSDIWKDTMADNNFRRIGNVFLTKDEAEKEVARRKAKQILLKDTKGYKPVWDGSHLNYEVWFNLASSCFGVSDYFSVVDHRDLWFASKEDAMASIKEHEREWKIYLGVEG